MQCFLTEAEVSRTDGRGIFLLLQGWTERKSTDWKELAIEKGIAISGRKHSKYRLSVWRSRPWALEDEPHVVEEENVHDGGQQSAGKAEVARGQRWVIPAESSDSIPSIERLILRLSREEDFLVLHLNEHI